MRVRVLFESSTSVHCRTNFYREFTSTKLCQKVPQSKSGCGFFDQICSFGLATGMLGMLWHVIYCWKGLENAFPTVYYIPLIFLISIRKKKKTNKICNRLATADQAGQKNCSQFQFLKYQEAHDKTPVIHIA